MNYKHNLSFFSLGVQNRDLICDYVDKITNVDSCTAATGILFLNICLLCLSVYLLFSLFCEF